MPLIKTDETGEMIPAPHIVLGQSFFCGAWFFGRWAATRNIIIATHFCFLMIFHLPEDHGENVEKVVGAQWRDSASERVEESESKAESKNRFARRKQ